MKESTSEKYARELYDLMEENHYDCGVKEDPEKQFVGICAVPWNIATFYVA